MIEQTIVALTAIGMIGIACQWLAWWLKLPAILFLLVAGIIAGPVTGFIRPNELFGELLFPIVSLGVAVILFEGGLTLRFHEIREIGTVVHNLVTLGTAVTWCIIAVATHWLLGFSWELSFLFGALVVVTGPTVIIPLLRTVRPTANIANILRWEGIIIDPLGALLAVLVFEFIISGQDSHTMRLFGAMILTGGVCGASGALILATILRRHWMPEYLHNVAALAFVLGIYTLSNELQHESGLLAVTLMGIMLANLKQVPIEDILDFKESLSLLVISLLFIILAARIEFGQIIELGWGALGVFLVILLIARPVAVQLSALRSKLNWRERALLSWIAPRGIVAAAVSALFALRLEGMGMPEAHLLVPLTFMVIIGTVVLQSASARPLANILNVSEPEPRGVLFIGAHRTARAIAKALADNGFRIKLADTSWDNIRAARMDGFSTYFGNVVSEHADRHLELVGIGRLFAMSRRPAFNALACLRYKNEFGGNAVFALKTPEEKGANETRAISSYFSGQQLFGKDITLAKLESLMGQGAVIRTTPLSEDFDFATYDEKYQNKAVHLFALTEKGRLRVFTKDSRPEPVSGWKIISLIPGDVLEQSAADKQNNRNGDEDDTKSG